MRDAVVTTVRKVPPSSTLSALNLANCATPSPVHMQAVFRGQEFIHASRLRIADLSVHGSFDDDRG
jgi:hypothetical protein